MVLQSEVCYSPHIKEKHDVIQHQERRLPQEEKPRIEVHHDFQILFPTIFTQITISRVLLALGVRGVSYRCKR
ncbi:MAG: hypothetical protein Q8N08_05845 [Methanobacteriaceae archaeon]|nr:hypothetical protein [Methanobacteriaceae archaeon]